MWEGSKQTTSTTTTTTTDHHIQPVSSSVIKNVKGFRNAPIPLNSLLLVIFFSFLFALSRVLEVLVHM